MRSESLVKNKIIFNGTGRNLYPESKLIIRNWILAVITKHGALCGKIAYNFVSDRELLEINRSFLNHHTLTDIITFDYSEKTGKKKVVCGEIFISYERVKENALGLSLPFSFEMKRVIVHGALHLLGYADKSDAQKRQMRKAEDQCLNLFKKII